MARDIAMHIAASNPLYVRPDEIDADALNREKEIYRSQLREEKKPEKIWDKIIEGKLKNITKTSVWLNKNLSRIRISPLER